MEVSETPEGPDDFQEALQWDLPSIVSFKPSLISQFV